MTTTTKHIASPVIAFPPPALTTEPPIVEIVVPVYNEEDVLATSINRLNAFLTESFPFRTRIVIADNASTDATLSIAHGLASALPGVDVVHLATKGRGRALRSVWTTSDAEVVCYMDVDLSTDLRGLLPLVAPLLSGHSELAIGTRLDRSARVQRGTKRELISRTYNKLLRTTLRARFSDAQCGFKAVRGDVVRPLLNEVQDQEWFFDTELLIVAQRLGMRIHEVPVDWVDDPDSSVHITKTAMQDLRGIARLARSSHVTKFVGIGILSTLAYALLYLVMRGPLGATGANAAALAVTAVANTAANRRFTFKIYGRARLLRQHLMGAGVFAVTLTLTNAALFSLNQIDPRAPRTIELAVLVVAGIGATIMRYVAMRWWVFAHRGDHALAPSVVSPLPTIDRGTIHAATDIQ